MTSTPEKQGMNSELLAGMFDIIMQQHMNFHSVLIIRNGYIVADAYIHPFSQNTTHVLHSATKSIVSALVGIDIDKGYIDSVNQTVLDFFPERTIANLDSRKKTITLKHLLTMASGLRWDDTNFGSVMQMQLSPDWTQHMLDLPMVAQPGTKLNYNNGVSFLISAIIQEKTGTNTLEFANEYLFRSLNISDITWLSNPQGISVGYGRIWMKPHDMAKIGYLYLNEGLWDGQQLLSSAWIEASSSKHFSFQDGGGYGYNWWIENSGIYSAEGFSGQRIIVIPEQNMVVVFTGGFYDEKPEYQLLHSYIIPAVISSNPMQENPDGVALLESRIQTLANPKPMTVPPLPDMAQIISGKRYILEDDTLGWQSFSLNFQEENASIKLFIGEDSLVLSIGLDDVYRVTRVDQPKAFLTLLNIIESKPPDIDHIIHETDLIMTGSVALKGFWKDNNTFVLNEQIVGEHETLELTLSFDEDGVDILGRAHVMGTSLRTHGLITGISESKIIQPNRIILDQNYPNPFNPSTTIRYSIPCRDFASLKILNTMGEEIATLVEADQNAGTYEKMFDASRLPSGVYYSKLQFEGFTNIKKLLLLK
jgi:CubicO group peptidase (beta-lactamase class C family)